MSVDFPKAFDNFIDRREYDQAENALFSMVKISFKAGWLAAGGKPPEPQKVVELVRHHKEISLSDSNGDIESDIQLDDESDKNT